VAAARILNLSAQMMQEKLSGAALKERLPEAGWMKQLQS